MAVEVYCDYCGEAIVGEFAEITTSGDHEGGRIVARESFQYHAGNRADDQSCYRLALRALSDLGRWAHRREGSRLVWRLAEPGPATDPGGGCPVGDEWSRRVNAGTALYKLDLPEVATRGLREVNLVTLEEVAGRTEEEIRTTSGVGSTSLRRIKEEMERRGLVFREDREAVS